MLRHARIRRLVESAYVQRLRVPQRTAHVIQALKGDVLICVPGHNQARLMNLPVERLHRVRPQRPQNVARLILSDQVARLLQFPRQVRAEALRDPHETIDEPRRASATDHGLGDGAKGTRQWRRQPVQEPVHHVEGDHARDARAVGGRAHDEVAAEGDPEGGGVVDAKVVQHRLGRALPLGL